MSCKLFIAAMMLSIVPGLVCAQPTAVKSNTSSANHEGLKVMSRVTGIGGIFIKAKNPAKLRAWYKKHLGIDVQAWGGTAFHWVDEAGHRTAGTTALGYQ